MQVCSWHKIVLWLGYFIKIFIILGLSHSFQMYGKKHCEHPDKLFEVRESNYTGLEWHEGEQIMTELFIAFINLPAFSE